MIVLVMPEGALRGLHPQVKGHVKRISVPERAFSEVSEARRARHPKPFPH
jgi:hypothetical protein